MAILKHRKLPQKEEQKPAVTKAKSIPVSQLVDQVLSGKWKNANVAAGNLPSAVNNCLKSSDTVIICFSSEQQRLVGNSTVMFTTKSTISSFNSNGQFKVKYYYNVLDVSPSSKSGPAVDPAGLRLTKGWQEPQLVMQCQSLDNNRLSCLQGKYKFNFTN